MAPSILIVVRKRLNWVFAVVVFLVTLVAVGL